MNQALADPYMHFAVDLAIDILLKATLVLAIAGLVSWWLRGTSAALRNAVWTVALGSLLLLPVLAATLPGWRLDPLYIAMEADATASYPVAGAAELDARPTAAADLTPRAALLTGDEPSSSMPGAARTVPEGAAATGLSAIEIGLLLWSIGVLVLLTRLGLALLRVHRLTHDARPAPAELQERASRLAAEVGIQRPVRVLISDSAEVPLTWGAWAPLLILPEAAVAWTHERSHVVLLHELAHVKRWDYPALLMAEVACAIYWPNPLVWLAAKQGAMERERACDDEALRSGVPSDVYATHLLEIARARVEIEAPPAAFAFARPWSLKTRVRMVLARGLDRAPLTQRRMLCTGLSALLFALPLASVDVWGTISDGDPVETRVLQLGDDDDDVRRYAAWALGELESRRAVRPLIERLGDENADVRLVAAWALGEIKDYAAVQPLIELLDDADPLMREMAVLSLGEIEHPAAIDPLGAAPRRHAELREPVIWALGEIGPEAERERRALFAEWGRQPYENDEVWTGHLDSSRARPLPNDVDSLIPALRDEDPQRRLSAAEHLGRIGAERAVEALLDALRDPEPAVRAMAIWALDETNPSRQRGRKIGRSADRTRIAESALRR